MEKIVDELHKIMKFKDCTEVGDIILIVIEEPQALMYGRVTAIERDTQKKDEWWHLSFHILAVPPQPTQWTLRMTQFNGEEIFTMDYRSKHNIFLFSPGFSSLRDVPFDRLREQVANNCFLRSRSG